MISKATDNSISPFGIDSEVASEILLSNSTVDIVDAGLAPDDLSSIHQQ